MRKYLHIALMVAALAAAPLAAQRAAAAPLITLNPAGGALQGNPGSVVGWGFTVQSSPTEWVSFMSSFVLIESNPAMGVYTDFIGLNGGPSSFLLPLGDPDWVQGFDNGAMLGLGSYAISSTAVPGDFTGGLIRVLWASYSDDPFTCGECFVDTFSQDVPFSVTATPEPSTAALLLAGLAALGLRFRCYSSVSIFFRNSSRFTMML